MVPYSKAKACKQRDRCDDARPRRFYQAIALNDLPATDLRALERHGREERAPNTGRQLERQPQLFPVF